MSLLPCFTDPAAASGSRGLLPVTQAQWPALKAWLTPAERLFAETASRFEGRMGQWLPLPGEGETPGRALIGLGDGRDPLPCGDAPGLLPQGVWRLEDPLHALDPVPILHGWGCGAYVFDRFKTVDRPQPVLVWPDGIARPPVERMIRAVWRVRDLVNLPANHLGPAALAAAAEAIASAAGATIRVIAGEDLLNEGWPLIHAVGRAAAEPPRLIDLSWGEPGDPRLTLVGKGVTFDTGGLDIKPSANMLLMKKDMAGAAHALALAEAIMASGWRVRLRVLIAAVENAVGPGAMRPGDVLESRAGLTVEIGNTDAEGRLVLADCLTAADAERPDLILDFATLTGAARVALGPDIPAMFTNRDSLAEALLQAAAVTQEGVWRLPLWPGYRADLSSPIADLQNVAGNSFAGSIYAALFLEAFLKENSAWMHFDLYGWNDRPRPGRPRGGEACLIRPVLRMLADRFGPRP